MVESPGSPFRSANAGEHSPRAEGRVDVRQHWSAGRRYKNIEPVPLSGFKQMDGSFDHGRTRRRMAVLAHSAPVVTAGPHTGTQVIWSGTVAGLVTALDCGAIVADTGEHTVQAQVLSGAVWVNFGAALPVSAVARAMTFAVKPGAGINATGVRLLATFSVSASITTGTVTLYSEGTTKDVPRGTAMKHSGGERYVAALYPGFMDIYSEGVFVAGVALPEALEALQRNCMFYAEDATIGVFQRDMVSKRARRAGQAAAWVRDDWPYTGIPEVDLGGTYAKTDDQWAVNIKYTGAPFIYLQLSVDGELTAALPFVDALNAPVAAGGAVDFTLTASNIKTALEALPSLGATVTVVISALAGASYDVQVTFGGALSGAEYQLVATIPNTAEAASLGTHVLVGETQFEPVFSVTRGYPGVVGLVADRLGYGDVKAVPPAVSWSKGGEYFDLNIKAAGDNAARLDKLRAGNVSERVIGFVEATYPVIVTDGGVYFISNRSIVGGQPLNYVSIGNAGGVPGCPPVKLEGKVYYLGRDPFDEGRSGHQLLSLAYSEIETSFDPVPESIFAEHLVRGIVAHYGQSATSESGASKHWLLRKDGRVIAANVIKSQDVLGFCEWVLAANGAAREMFVDAANDVWLVVERNGDMRFERLSRNSLFHATVSATPDLAGTVNGLGHLEGLPVWAEVDGYVLGPFTVSGGAIDLGDPYVGPALVGVWQPPVFETLPRVMITRNDEVIRRPGRIFGLRLQLIDTTSIAVAANDGAVRNCVLRRTTDPVDAPANGFTGSIREYGLSGHKVGTTAVVTQIRPGRMHVRDMDLQEML